MLPTHRLVLEAGGQHFGWTEAPLPAPYLHLRSFSGSPCQVRLEPDGRRCFLLEDGKPSDIAELAAATWLERDRIELQWTSFMQRAGWLRFIPGRVIAYPDTPSEFSRGWVGFFVHRHGIAGAVEVPCSRMTAASFSCSSGSAWWPMHCDATRSGPDHLIPHLQRLVAEVEGLHDVLVVLEGSTADRVHRLGSRLISVAAGEVCEDSVAAECVLSELTWVRDHCEDLIYAVEGPIWEPL